LLNPWGLVVSTGGSFYTESKARVSSAYLKYFQDIQKKNKITVRFYQAGLKNPIVITCGPDKVGLICPIHLGDHDLYKLMNAYAQSIYEEKDEN
jgi:hypothetical protein